MKYSPLSWVSSKKRVRAKESPRGLFPAAAKVVPQVDAERQGHEKVVEGDPERAAVQDGRPGGGLGQRRAGLLGDLPDEPEGDQLGLPPLQRGGLLGRGQGKDHQTVDAQQIQDERVDDQHTEAEHRPVFVVIERDIGDGEQHDDDGIDHRRLPEHLDVWIHRPLPPVAVSGPGARGFIVAPARAACKGEGLQLPEPLCYNNGATRTARAGLPEQRRGVVVATQDKKELPACPVETTLILIGNNMCPVHPHMSAGRDFFDSLV